MIAKIYLPFEISVLLLQKMYQGFNLKIILDDFLIAEIKNHKTSLQHIRNKINIHKKLENYVFDKEIDVAKLEADWFPEIKADVFISHSHQDEKLAIYLADWLRENLGIISFVDSCLWGYAGDLLKKIDNQMCVLRESPTGNTYDYEKRNNSTAHVYNILSIALQKMIDKTECLFFLNTPNSISLDEITQDPFTSSCWIYNEIMFSRMVRRREPKREKINTFSQKTASVESFKYTLNTDHLIDISKNELGLWLRKSSPDLGKINLDILYKIVGLI